MNDYKLKIPGPRLTRLGLLTLIVVSVLVAIFLASALNSFTRVSDSALADTAPTVTPRANAPSSITLAKRDYLPIIFLNSATAGSAWLLNGNAGTNPATDFLGTTDNVTFTIRVSNTVAYRIAPAYDAVSPGFAPNIIGGSVGNTVVPGVHGATIAGGGVNGLGNSIAGNYAVIGGGAGNTAGLAFATIAGGGDNTASNFFATVGGGDANEATQPYATIGGGSNNTASQPYATIGGGIGNIVSGDRAAIGGGYQNTAGGAGAFIGGGGYDGAGLGGNKAAAPASTIGGGITNTILLTATYAAIMGGSQNSANNKWATIGGGVQNTAAGLEAFIGGGAQNSAAGQAAVVGGGVGNTAGNYTAVVAGGQGNSATGFAAMIPGGNANQALGDSSFAAGYQAQAKHDGSFVWADKSALTPFASTAADQFLIRAAGFVGINTNNPTRDLTISSNSSFVTGIDLYNTTSVSGSVGYRLQVNGSSVTGRVGNFELWDSGLLMTVQPGGNVGLGGVTSPGNILTLPNNADPSGRGLANAWNTYSSRRWKTNITTLPDALSKIAQLRGVTFDWKANGTHDIGLIAEEVGQVFPEVVTYEANGVDAQAVDYSRLVAVLIEGVKAQQDEIKSQQATIDQVNRDKDARLSAQQDEITQLKSQNANLDARLTALEQGMGAVNGASSNPAQGNGANAFPISRDAMFIGALVVIGMIVIGRRRRA